MPIRLARFVIAALLACGVATTAQAQPATTLTLACKGTMTVPGVDIKPEAISIGLIVNFTTRTVQGFGPVTTAPYAPDIPVMITAANDTTITFGGRANGTTITFADHQQILTSINSIQGHIDRVTGDVEATLMQTNPQTGQMIGQFEYALECRPTQRMF